MQELLLGKSTKSVRSATGRDYRRAGHCYCSSCYSCICSGPFIICSPFGFPPSNTKDTSFASFGNYTESGKKRTFNKVGPPCGNSCCQVARSLGINLLDIERYKRVFDSYDKDKSGVIETLVRTLFIKFVCFAISTRICRFMR